MLRSLLCVVIAASFSTGAIARSNADPVMLRWNQEVLDAIIENSQGPTVAARSIGIVYTAAYNAWSKFDEVALSTTSGGAHRRPLIERNDRNKRTAVSYAIHTAMADLFPKSKAQIDKAMRDLGYDPLNMSTDVDAPWGLGRFEALTLIRQRHQDGSNQLQNYLDTTGYRPVNDWNNVVDVEKWQPPVFKFPDGRAVQTSFLTPHWGHVTPFADVVVTDVELVPPAPRDSKKFISQAREVITYTENLNNLTKVIAEYWADGPGTATPPGHWCEITAWVIRRDGMGVDDSVKLLFMVGNSLMDSAIVCWHHKVKYDYVRPLTAIQYLFPDEEFIAFTGYETGMRRVKGKDWLPYQPLSFITPPFAEFPSGHSTFSMGAATILRLYTGSDHYGRSVTIPVGWSNHEKGVPTVPVTLSWETYSVTARQSAMSRLYGGIHFMDGNLEGARAGEMCAIAVYEKATALIDGTYTPP